MRPGWGVSALIYDIIRLGCNHMHAHITTWWYVEYRCDFHLRGVNNEFRMFKDANMCLLTLELFSALIVIHFKETNVCVLYKNIKGCTLRRSFKAIILYLCFTAHTVLLCDAFKCICICGLHLKQGFYCYWSATCHPSIQDVLIVKIRAKLGCGSYTLLLWR